MLDKNNINQLFPYNGDTNIEKMNEKEQDEYFKMYNIYRRLFTEYIIEKLNLKQYDNILKESNLKFISVKKEKMDFYQEFSSENLIYFYIRNNIYIEKLNEEEKILLKNKIMENNFELDKKTIKMIENSYKKVIFENVLKDNRIYQIAYGPNSKNYFSRNDSLVIGVRYDELYETKTEMKEKQKEQIEFFCSVLSELLQQSKDKLDVPIQIIKYNQYSVIV